MCRLRTSVISQGILDLSVSGIYQYVYQAIRPVQNASSVLHPQWSVLHTWKCHRMC